MTPRRLTIVVTAALVAGAMAGGAARTSPTTKSSTGVLSAYDRISSQAAPSGTPEGDLDAYMRAHRDAVQAELDATTNPDRRAALQDEIDAINAFLGENVPPTTTTTTAAPTTTSTVKPTTTTAAATTTTVKPTTTTAAPTTTVKPTTTTAAPTTTTVKPTTTTASPPPTTAPNSAACVLAKADQPRTVAFCDSFDNNSKADPSTRSGDLNSAIWGVSRTNTLSNMGQGQFNEWVAPTMVGCGSNHVVSAPPRDVAICNGRVQVASSDGGGQPIVALYPKQPFDIAGRTGTVQFDVSADSQGTHAAWPEFWWTDQPVPAPHAGELSAQTPFARNSFGFSIAAQCGSGQVGIDAMAVTRNYQASYLGFTGGSCVTKGSATGALNHFEVRISQQKVEVWGTDAGSSALKLMATATNANITMTRGLVWVESVHYNACKTDSQCDHTFAFDNVGWDGPAPYRDLSFDVPDANVSRGGGRMELGWKVTTSSLALNTVPVYRRQTPTSALVTFNWFPEADRVVPSVRVNGGAWHDTAWPGWANGYAMNTIAVSVPVSETKDGVNTLEFRTPTGAVILCNVNLILVAGSAAA